MAQGSAHCSKVAKSIGRKKLSLLTNCRCSPWMIFLLVLDALDLAHVQRIILVGDPNQLPPIGVGRPFADLVTFLDNTQAKTDDGNPFSGALARLTVEVRQAAGENETSDALRLASWFTREPQPVDADRVLSDLGLGHKFNDLDLKFWTNPDELRVQLIEAFVSTLV